MSLHDLKWKYFFRSSKTVNSATYTFEEVMVIHPDVLPVFILYPYQVDEYRGWLLMYGMTHPFLVVPIDSQPSCHDLSTLMKDNGYPYMYAIIQWDHLPEVSYSNI